jgi:chromosome segregation ATPase
MVRRNKKISGPEALRSLDRALDDIRREEKQMTRLSADAASRIGRLREIEAEQFIALAELRLDPARKTEITGEISRAEKQARSILEAHEGQYNELGARLDEIDGEIKSILAERAKAQAVYEKAEAELDALSGAVFKGLKTDEKYQAQLASSNEAKSIAEHALKKTEVAEKDRDEKGKPYREDPLFMYLWETGFGTSAYGGNNLVRYFDKMIAKMIRYHDAKPNFSILNEIPMRLREHAERLLEDADAEHAKLKKLEDKAFDAAGGKAYRLNSEKAEKEIAAIDEAQVRLEDERDELARKHTKLSDGGDSAYREAVETLTEGLQRETISELYDAARQTSSREDDLIIRKIDAVRAEILEQDDDINEAKVRLKTLAARRRELEDIEWEFKKSNFDDPRMKFDDDLVEDMLGEFLKGAITAAGYWGQWQDAQRGSGYTPRSSSSKNERSKSGPWSKGNLDFGSFGTPSSDFSRPRGSSRQGSKGTRKHGNFKTGGKF